MNDEIWLPVVGFEKRYLVSNEGRVFSISRQKVMRPYHYKKGKGYLGVKLNKKQAFVHRLVFEAFMHPIPSDKQINHKDGNHINNHVDNLECVTGRENVDHATETGLVNYGETQWKHKFTETEVREIKKRLRNGESQSKIAREYDVIPATINHMKTGRTWRRIE